MKRRTWIPLDIGTTDVGSLLANTSCPRCHADQRHLALIRVNRQPKAIHCLRCGQEFDFIYRWRIGWDHPSPPPIPESFGRQLYDYWLRSLFGQL